MTLNRAKYGSQRSDQPEKVNFEPITYLNSNFNFHFLLTNVVLSLSGRENTELFFRPVHEIFSVRFSEHQKKLYFHHPEVGLSVEISFTMKAFFSINASANTDRMFTTQVANRVCRLRQKPVWRMIMHFARAAPRLKMVGIGRSWLF